MHITRISAENLMEYIDFPISLLYICKIHGFFYFLWAGELVLSLFLNPLFSVIVQHWTTRWSSFICGTAQLSIRFSWKTFSLLPYIILIRYVNLHSLQVSILSFMANCLDSLIFFNIACTCSCSCIFLILWTVLQGVVRDLWLFSPSLLWLFFFLNLWWSSHNCDTFGGINMQCPVKMRVQVQWASSWLFRVLLLVVRDPDSGFCSASFAGGPITGYRVICRLLSVPVNVVKTENISNKRALKLIQVCFFSKLSGKEL